jgi:hypothetical protein
MPTKAQVAHFRATAPKYMRLLMADFGFSEWDAAAIFGNAGHESKGLTDDQEDKPVVPGSRGGRNWMQWTGPRRRELEDYSKRNKLDPDSDEAAYKFLFVELRGTEKKAVLAVKRATTLKEKVIAFEVAFLRAGVKHYPSRLEWAEIALDALKEAPEPAPKPTVPAEPEKPASGPRSWVSILIDFILSLFKRR